MKGMSYPLEGVGLFFQITYKEKQIVVFLPTEEIPRSQVGKVVKYKFEEK